MMTTNPQIQLALLLRAQQFELESSIKCDLNVMIEVFDEVLWSDYQPSTLHQAIDFIFSLSHHELLVAFTQLKETPRLSYLYENY